MAPANVVAFQCPCGIERTNILPRATTVKPHYLRGPAALVDNDQAFRSHLLLTGVRFRGRLGAIGPVLFRSARDFLEWQTQMAQALPQAADADAVRRQQRGP